jgi:hypothetical protein
MAPQDGFFSTQRTVLRRPILWALLFFYVHRPIVYQLYLVLQNRAFHRLSHSESGNLLAAIAILVAAWLALKVAAWASNRLSRECSEHIGMGEPDLSALVETILIYCLAGEAVRQSPRGDWLNMGEGFCLCMAAFLSGVDAYGFYATGRQRFREWGVGLLMVVLLLVALLPALPYHQVSDLFQKTPYDFLEMFLLLPAGLALIFNGLIFEVIRRSFGPLWAWALTPLAFMLFAVRPSWSHFGWTDLAGCSAVTAIGLDGLFLASRGRQLSS